MAAATAAGPHLRAVAGQVELDDVGAVRPGDAEVDAARTRARRPGRDRRPR